MPELGHVSGSSFGFPSASRFTAPFASFEKATIEPWHCQQPFTASPMLPGIPQARSASTLSRLWMISPARAWWLTVNCAASSA